MKFTTLLLRSGWLVGLLVLPIGGIATIDAQTPKSQLPEKQLPEKQLPASQGPERGPERGQWDALDDGEDDEPIHRVAIFMDCSLSMDLVWRDGETRRDGALASLGDLLDRLPKRTEFLLVGFNERSELLHARPLPLNGVNRTRALRFAQALVPRGDTLPADSVAAVLRRHPTLDSVFLITDARAPEGRIGRHQAVVLGQLRRRHRVPMYWVVVDPPPIGALRPLLDLAGGTLLSPE